MKFEFFTIKWIKIYLFHSIVLSNFFSGSLLKFIYSSNKKNFETKRKTNDNLVITITIIETNMLQILKYDLMISINIFRKKVKIFN